MSYVIKNGDSELIIEISENTNMLERFQEYHTLLFWHTWDVCQVMHGEDKIVTICRNGTCVIHNSLMLPYNLYLEEAGDLSSIDVRMQNLDNFYYWCATRTIPRNRKYAKEILNSVNASHDETDRSRAVTALAHNCLSLTDIYWTKALYQKNSFEEINLYENYKENRYINTALNGQQVSIESPYLIASTLATQGCFPKAWIETKGQLYLIKGGDTEAVDKELLASKIAACFKVNQVAYELGVYEKQKVSVCKLISSIEKSIVSMEYFLLYLQNRELNPADYVLGLDAYSYYMMNIVDYLVGNTDRHWGNWGVLVDNTTNQPIRLHDLMDFNRSFEAYDSIEGANCLTTYLLENRKQTQKEAAVEVVKKVGLNQIADIEEEWFADEQIKKMFFERLDILQRITVQR